MRIPSYFGPNAAVLDGMSCKILDPGPLVDSLWLRLDLRG